MNACLSAVLSEIPPKGCIESVLGLFLPQSFRIECKILRKICAERVVYPLYGQFCKIEVVLDLNDGLRALNEAREGRKTMLTWPMPISLLHR